MLPTSTPQDWHTLDLWCSCGAGMTGRYTDPLVVRRLEVAWRRTHQGPGHAPYTPSRARATRRAVARQITGA